MKRMIVAFVAGCSALLAVHMYADIIEDIKAQGQDVFRNISEQASQGVTQTITEKASEWSSVVGHKITDWFKGLFTKSPEELATLKAKITALKEKYSSNEHQNLVEQLKENATPEDIEKLDRLNEHIQQLKQEIFDVMSNVTEPQK